MVRFSSRLLGSKAAMRRHRRCVRRRLAVEPLEVRTVLAGGLVGDLVVFGDSLSDTGNGAFANLEGYDPYDQYWQGRVSNGPMWVETLAEYLGEPAVQPSSLGGLNYAVLGATVGLESQAPWYPWYTLPPSSIAGQVGEYLTNHVPTANDLFVVFAGANDLFQSLPTGEVFSPLQTATTLVDSMETLFSEGARQFVVPNLPPLGETPLLRGLDLVVPGARAAANQWTIAFDTALAGELADFQSDHSDATVVAIDNLELFQIIIQPDNPFGFTNVTDPVGPLVSGPNGEPGFFLQEVTAPDAENYFFYDGVHPTTNGHQLIGLNTAAKVYEALGIQDLVVTSTADNVDPLSGDLTMREMINVANAVDGEQSISFAPGVLGTITLDSTLGQLAITDDLTITGPGAHRLAVNGNGAIRVFYVGLDTTATISGLTITEGKADGNSPIIHSLGGGILNQGNLMLKDAIVSHNQAVGATNDTISVNRLPLNGVGIGGGVANLGTLTVSASTFTGNLARGADGNQGGNFPGFGIGGGLANGGMATATVTDSQFTSNLAQGGNGSMTTHIPGAAGGGAIGNFGFTVPGFPALAKLSVDGSRFSHNQAIAGNDNQGPVFPGTAIGGAIASHRLLSFGGSAALDVSDSTFDHNQAIGGNHSVVTPGGPPASAVPNHVGGGGIFVFGTGTISDSTIEHNQAIGGQGVAGSNGLDSTKNGGDARGGGINPGFPTTVVTISNCTITHNLAIGGQAGPGGTGGNGWGGGVVTTPSGTTLTITGSVISHNLAQGGSADTSGPASHGGEGAGGGIYNVSGSTTHVIASSINHNRAIGGTGRGGGDGGHGLGGGIYNDGASTITDSTVKHNQAWGGRGGRGGDGGDGLGGGLYNGGSATVTHTPIAHNKAKGGSGRAGGDAGTGIGGGVYNEIDNGATISIDEDERDLIFANMADEFDDWFGILL